MMNSIAAHERRQARELAMQALYQYEMTKPRIDDLLRYQWVDERPPQEVRSFADDLVLGTLNHLEEIDRLIKLQSQNWDIDRITNVDRAILRFSVFSLLYIPNMPKKVVINEAIEIAKRYGTERSFQFVNGVLDGIKIPEHTD